jgi:phage terminase large subunit GpA-like protein
MITAKELARKVLTVLAPPPKYTVSEWSDNRRKLSAEASALPGSWRTRLVEYMREPMDCIGDPRIRRVVVMAAAQVAKTEIILNCVGYCIDYDPSPIMVVQPTLAMAESFSKDRVAPMLRDTPALRDKVKDAKTRDSANTIKQKQFPGGHLTMVGANSPTDLASRPIRAVFCDEVDRYPPSAGTEGDPINLAIKRTATFWNRIILLVSTPTNKGSSRIEDEFEKGDQRRRWCPCPHCDECQILKWSNVKWSEGLPDTAEYMCEHCGALWSDPQRIVAVRKGEWRASAPFTGSASFHIPGLLSPFTTMSDGVREFLAARKDPVQLKVWVNTYLGETWEEKGARLDPHELMERREDYETRVPEGVTVLTAGIDVQDDRIEAEIVGWGDDYESWSIDYATFYGDPTDPAFWNELTRFLTQVFRHPLYGEMTIRASCIDTGGHYTQETYRYVKGRSRVYGIKGVPGIGKPVVGSPSRNNLGKIPLFPVGVHTAKELVYSRLKSNEGDAGYCHFSKERGDDYFQQLTAEELVTRYRKGFKHIEYVKIRKRNEALDNRVYATAALEMLNVDLRAQRRAMDAQVRAADNELEDDQKRDKPRKKSSYVGRWRE